MKPAEFQKWLTQADNLTPFQRQRAMESLGSPDPGRASHDVIEERIADERCCPRCHMPGATRHGMANGLQRYKCNHCCRTFNSLTGTPLARLRKKEKWLEYSEALKDGISINKAAERCDIDPTTAFRWRHRFLKALFALVVLFMLSSPQHPDFKGDLQWILRNTRDGWQGWTN